MEVKEVVILGSIVCGVNLGFLLFNMHPAKVFMGDTGSLLLGGAIASMALYLKMPLILVVIALIVVFFVLKKKENSAREENQIIDSTSEGITPTSKTKIAKEYEKKSVFDFMEFDSVKDNMIVQKGGKKFLMAIECKGVNYDLMSEVEKAATEQGFSAFLNTLREPIQIYIQTRTTSYSIYLFYKHKKTSYIVMYKLTT